MPWLATGWGPCRLATGARRRGGCCARERTRAAEQEARNCAGGAESLGPDTDLLVAASYLNGKASSPTLLATAEQAVASKRRHTTGGELQLAESLHNLGAIRAERGEFAEALPLHEEAYSLRLHALGADDSRLADSLDHVGWSLIRLERFEQAQSALDRSLAIRESFAATDPAGIARTLEQYALLRRYQGLYPAALEIADRALRLRRLEPPHPATASLLHVRGDILFAMGEMRPARENYTEALAMAEQTLGAAHPVVARYLRRVAHAESVFGDLARARSLRERALAVGEAGFAPCHPDLPAFRNDLALSLWSDGDYVAARRMYHRALDQNERCLGKGHSLTTTIVHNLGLLAADMGDRAEAERLQDRAVRDWSASMGADHPYVAMALDALAEAVEAQGRLLDTRKLYERAMAIRTRALGPGHSDVAWTLASLARIKAKSGDPSGALRDLTEALAMHDRASLSDQPDRVASLLVQKGEVERALGRYSSARVSYAEALSTRIRLFGESHPLAADTDARLAAVDFALGDFGHAMQEALRAEDVGRNHLRFLVRYLPERQGLAYSDKRARGLDLALSVVADTAAVNASSVLDGLIRSRSLVLDELATRARTTTARHGDGPQVEQAAALARQRFANLMVRSLQEPVPRDLLDEARRNKEEAEAALAERSVEARAEMARTSTGLDAVRQGLPAGAALVSFVQYERTRRSPAGSVAAQPWMAAFVIRAGSRDVAFVSLGAVSDTERLIAAWRAEATTGLMAKVSADAASRRYRAVGTRLRRAVWDPIAPHLTGSTLVFVVPDGALSVVPLAALPVADSAYLLEAGPGPIHYLTAERDLVAPGARPVEGLRRLLAVGGAAFGDAAPRVGAGPDIGACGLRELRFPPLAGTLDEVRELARVWAGHQATPTSATVLVGPQADEQTFKRDAHLYSVLHLATHGFFLGASCGPAAPAGTRGAGGLARIGDRPAENPLLLSGLALAGANRRALAGPNEDEGILTAEEVATLDLHGVEWAVLSACDTGVGEIKAGEGVFGLRRAFQVAGARTVVMSLWSVEDQATRAWMRALYEGRFQRKLSTADAVHQASLAVLRDRRAKGQSTHPFFWAAFVAAGDWR